MALGAQATAQQPVNQPTYQIHRDVIRGRVITDSGAALANANVAVTMAPDRVTQFDTTDADGRYEVVFDKGTGDYLVHVAFTGRQTFRKRITRVGADSVFTVDAVMKSVVQQLAPVQVRATRTRPARNEALNFRTPGLGASEQSPGGVNGSIAPDLLGNLEAVAASLPGVSAVPGGGVSVLGAAPSQNATTLNGLDFGGGGIPRGANTAVRISSSTYDPARGGFSGGLTQVSLAPGNITTARRAYVTMDAPQLQAADAVARRSGVTYTSVDLDLGTDGGTNMDRWMYNSGFKYRRRFSDVVSLLSADDDLLQRSGVARDSVGRLLSTLNALGIPATVGTIPSSRITDYVSFMGRLDRPLFDYNSFTPLNTTWGVIGYANWNRTGALSLTPTVTPAHGGESHQINAGGQYLYSKYFGKLKDQLTEVRTGVSMSRSDNDPYLRLPDGRVLLSSSFGDGTSGVASLGFAGNSGLESRNRSRTWQTTSETHFFWKGRAAHRGKVYAESRLDDYSRNISANRLGSFSFNSLADLQANQPASFSRTLSTPVKSGGEWSGVLAASDQWRKTDRLTILYGARTEANVFTKAPPHNAQVETTFGSRTDHVPNGWHVSPRIGFNWLTTRTARRAGSSGYGSNMGSFISMARGVLRGGVGEFRQYPEPTLLADASIATGLATGAQRITCVGPAVPIPDWQAFLASEGAVPSSCIGPATASGFADAAPAVQLFDRNYQPARSWRGNLQWGSAIKKLVYSVDVIYSANLNQPSVIDLNFDGTPEFTLATDGRPVFVPESSIVASTGAVAAAAARRSASFGSVMSRRSDLRGWARQLMVRGRPGTGFIGGRWLLDGTYTITQTRAQTRGFDGAALGDPRAITWSRGDYTPTHEIYLQAGFQTRWLVVTTAGKIISGLPYTPVIGSDVNGDGLANDRAFVFNGATAGDPALASAMQTLLATTSDNARDCLLRQDGNVAARNSCDGPWSTTMNLTLAPTGRLWQKLKMRRHRVWLNISNPLAGLDQLLHGGKLHGWGTQPFPDRVLYYVRGYDSTTNRFRYEVNPRFGDTRPRTMAFRSPFRVTLDVSMDFSRDGEAQQLDRILNPGRRGNPGKKLDEPAIVKRYCGNLPNWYNEILQQTDSLLLTRDQVDALRGAQAEYSARVTTHWTEWAREMASQPDRFNSVDLVKRQNKMINDGWELARQEAHKSLPIILSPIQLGLLPGNARMLYNAKEPVTGVRYFTSNAC